MVEMIAVVVITAILAGIAIPRFSNSIAMQQAGSAARRLAADIDYARERARTIGENINVGFNLASNSYGLSNTPHLNHPDKAYRIVLSQEPYRAAIHAADCGGDRNLVFDMYGKPDSGAAIVITSGDYAKLVIVDSVTGETVIGDPSNVSTVDAQFDVLDTLTVRINVTGGIIEVTDAVNNFMVSGG